MQLNKRRVELTSYGSERAEGHAVRVKGFEFVDVAVRRGLDSVLCARVKNARTPVTGAAYQEKRRYVSGSVHFDISDIDWSVGSLQVPISLKQSHIPC
jgi:hypothetical protein